MCVVDDRLGHQGQLEKATALAAWLCERCGPTERELHVPSRLDRITEDDGHAVRGAVERFCNGREESATDERWSDSCCVLRKQGGRKTRTMSCEGDEEVTRYVSGDRRIQCCQVPSDQRCGVACARDVTYCAVRIDSGQPGSAFGTFRSSTPGRSKVGLDSGRGVLAPPCVARRCPLDPSREARWVRRADADVDQALRRREKAIWDSVSRKHRVYLGGPRRPLFSLLGLAEVASREHEDHIKIECDLVEPLRCETVRGSTRRTSEIVGKVEDADTRFILCT